MKEFKFSRDSKRSRNLQELLALSAEGEIRIDTEEALILLRNGAIARGIGDDPTERTQRYLVNDQTFIWKGRTDEEYPTNLRQAA